MDVLLLQCVATLFMTGTIWFVQIVHYPLFGKVGRQDYVVYQKAHARLTGFVVGPPIIIELGVSGWLAFSPPPFVPKWQTWTGLGLVIGIWLSTGLLQIPQHTTLGRGYDLKAHRTLVFSNWMRTVLWSLRAGLALWMIRESSQR